jgi:hypothetical protein
MSLLSKPLDYSSGTTKATIEGIRSQLETQQRRMKENEREQQRIDQISSNIQGKFSAMRGGLSSLDPSSKKIFQEGHMKAYETELNNWSLNPTQENLNRLNTVVAEAQNFLKIAPAAYSSDNNTLINGVMNYQKFQQDPEEMKSMFEQKWGGEVNVRYNDETMQVEIVDASNGQENWGSVYGGRYKPSEENALVFTPKNNFNFTSSQDYAYTKGRPAIAAGNPELFGKNFGAEVNSNDDLKQSIAIQYGMRFNLDPQVVISDPELWETAQTMYLEDAQGVLGEIVAENERQKSAARNSARTSKYSGTRTVDFGGTSVKLDQIKSPPLLTIRGARSGGQAPISQVRLSAYKIEGGELYVDVIKTTYQFVDMSGNPLSGSALADAQADYSADKDLANVNYQVKEVGISETKQVTDPTELSSYMSELKRAGLKTN